MTVQVRILFRDQIHIGDNPEDNQGVPFAGQEWTTIIDAPFNDGSGSTLIPFHSGTDHDRNELVLNEVLVRLQRGAADQVVYDILTITPGLLKAFGNQISIRSRDSGGGSSGALDDFFPAALIVSYRNRDAMKFLPASNLPKDRIAQVG
jgi:hypothetical protein